MDAQTNIVDVTLENFQAEVAEKSQSVPVLLEFYAEGAEQSAATAAVLRKLAMEYQGKFVLARVEVQANAQLVQQLGVRTLPTIKVISQGQMAGDLEGPVEESQLRGVLDQLTMSPADRIREQMQALINGGDRPQAIALLRQVIAEEPRNYGLHTQLCDLLIQEGQLDEARRLLAELPADAPGLETPKCRMEFIDEAAELPALDELERRVAADDGNLRARYELAVKLVVEGQEESALEALLAVLMQDKTWEDELARLTMIRVFNMLGKGSELAATYRRKMFTFLH